MVVVMRVWMGARECPVDTGLSGGEAGFDYTWVGARVALDA